MLGSQTLHCSILTGVALRLSAAWFHIDAVSHTVQTSISMAQRCGTEALLCPQKLSVGNAVCWLFCRLALITSERLAGKTK